MMNIPAIDAAFRSLEERDNRETFDVARDARGVPNEQECAMSDAIDAANRILAWVELSGEGPADAWPTTCGDAVAVARALIEQHGIVAARHYIWVLRRVEELQGERERGRLEGIDEAAIIFDKKAEVHAAQAVWMGPKRQRYEGARRNGVEMSPMNGPALAHDNAVNTAAEIRALAEQSSLSALRKAQP